MITYTASVCLDDLQPTEAPARMRMATQAQTQEPAKPATIWDAVGHAADSVREQLEADGILEGFQIVSITKRVGDREDTAEAWALLDATAPAAFEGGPLDGRQHPAPPIGVVGAGQVRTARMEPGGFYELESIDWVAFRYLFTWIEDPRPPIEWL